MVGAHLMKTEWIRGWLAEWKFGGLGVRPHRCVRAKPGPQTWRHCLSGSSCLIHLTFLYFWFRLPLSGLKVADLGEEFWALCSSLWKPSSGLSHHQSHFSMGLVSSGTRAGPWCESGSTGEARSVSTLGISVQDSASSWQLAHSLFLSSFDL